MDDDTLVQKCSLCTHEAKATLKLVENASLVYTGEEIEPLEIVYSGSDWSGTEPSTIAYSNNIAASTETSKASGSITMSGKTATMEFSIEKATEDIEVTAAGYSEAYDGNPHGITVDAPDGSTVTYGEVEGTYDLTASPTLTNAGDMTVYYKVTNPNYENVVVDSATIVISKKPVTVIAQDKTIAYGDAAPDISDYGYSFDGVVGNENPTEVLGGGPVLSSSYQQNAPAGATFDIVVNIDAMKPDEVEPSNYTVSKQDGTLTVGQRELEIEWEDLEFTYDGENHIPTATVTNAVGEDKITLTVSGEKKNANIGDEKYTATVTGFTVEDDADGKKADNYKLPQNVTASFVIKPAPQDAPTGLGTEKESILNYGDGKITGVDSTMEYRKDGETDYRPITGTTVTGKPNSENEKITSGKYFVRVAGKTNYAPSADVEVTVEAEKKLTVTIPAETEQVGYDLTVDPAEVEWKGTSKITFALKPGFSKGDDFKVIAEVTENDTVNKTELALATDGTYSFSDIEENITVKVEGVVDNTAPAIQVTLGEDDFTTLMDKDDVEFEEYMGIGTKVTAAQTTTGGSDVTILYWESDEALAAEDLDAIEDEEWSTYTDGGITPSGDGNKIFYFKAVDEAGNESAYVSTEGFIYDGTAPKLSLGDDPNSEDDVFVFGISRRLKVTDANLEKALFSTAEKPEDISDDESEYTVKTASSTAVYYPLTRAVNDADKKSDDDQLSYKFVVTDKAGNRSVATYTIKPMDFVSTTKSWSKGSKKTADFKVNTILGSYSDVEDYAMKFVVKIDGKEIDAKNYTTEVAEDGSGTIIKLKADYLKTLKAAKHKIQVSVVAKKSLSGTTTETLDATETVEFTVSDNPATGDAMDLTLWGGMAMVSLLCGAAMILGLRKKEH